ncbi:MAG: bifunctional DNA-formamidopyrimidine glycosylase/DNA-(apurinic or apyrimidinic site) lyase [Myxococcales bacterium]|nr:bifunctional DNA-formamidopyrimidine glycosylase/DNA-(apurinic or apyrimidinic site) lyase [Myxococcales bacterium]
MPELPEVEVTRRAVEPLLVGRRLSGVATTAKSYFFLTPPAKLRERLLGRTVQKLERQGKYLLAALDDGSRLLLHLGMTGQLLASGARGFAPDAHTHLVLSFADRGPKLSFRDVRKFGKVRWLGPGKSDPRLDKLGLDALAVSAEHLFTESRKRRAAVKTLLLDQGVLAGVGNIYADEALFLAGIRPTRRARTLRREECRALASAVLKVLEAGIAAGGSSIDDFVRPDGTGGGYQDAHRVYGRAGEPCPRCGTAIRRVVIGQRSSCYCPSCQR